MTDVTMIPTNDPAMNCMNVCACSLSRDQKTMGRNKNNASAVGPIMNITAVNGPVSPAPCELIFVLKFARSTVVVTPMYAMERTKKS